MRPQKKQVICKQAPFPVGPYSQAIIAAPFVFVAGQRPVNPVTGEIPPGIAQQTRQCIENINQILIAAGSSLNSIVNVHMYLCDTRYFDAANEIYKQVIPLPHPSRTTVGTQLRGILVEIECIALIEQEDDDKKEWETNVESTTNQ